MQAAKIKVAFVELPEGLMPGTDAWEQFAQRVGAARPDVLVMNELPFGAWIAASPQYDDAVAAESVRVHEQGLDALRALEVPLVLGSRPIHDGDHLANEGFAIVEGEYRRVHDKQYLPAEPGFHEATWFAPRERGFEPLRVGALCVGMFLCTDLMFNEWARHYRRCAVNLIVVPRATEAAHRRWLTAGAMAAIVSGCYVVSSNRTGRGADGTRFGGKGFAFAPDGELIAETTADEPLATVDIDIDRVLRQQREYPCYVPELD